MNNFAHSFVSQLDPHDFQAGAPPIDSQTAVLIENIRHTLTIHAEMFRRILETSSNSSLMLAELLEDAGNRYIDFSELLCSASMREPID
jgi:hypothetical protein